MWKRLLVALNLTFLALAFYAMDALRWSFFVKAAGQKISILGAFQLSAISYWATQKDFFARKYTPQVLEFLKMEVGLSIVRTKSFVMIFWLSLVGYSAGLVTAFDPWKPLWAVFCAGTLVFGLFGLLGRPFSLLKITRENFIPFVLGNVSSVLAVGFSVLIGFELSRFFGISISFPEAAAIFAVLTLVASIGLTPGSIGVELLTAHWLESVASERAWWVAILHRVFTWYGIVLFGFFLELKKRR